ncbi:MAG: hypothetical protein OWU84_12035 [Firmicutes bacterium]|nr:hypothetical protein [Bacillota bacterium]
MRRGESWDITTGPSAKAATPIPADASYRLTREFTADRPQQVGMADIVYCETAKVRRYLAPIEELYSRAIVNWALGGPE